MKHPRSSVNNQPKKTPPPAPVGRFAPSPTGDLHFGSLVAAVGSFLETKHSGGSWLLRVEDIDPPREVDGSATRIIEDLGRLGLIPDGAVLYQSTRTAAYQHAVDNLLGAGLAFPCACSRKDLNANGQYAGTCRKGLPPGKSPRSIRFRVDDNLCVFDDKLQGEVSDPATGNGGDFIIRRADGLFAYQLAVVVDDHFQGVTQVVRGADLIDSTNRQIALQKALGFATPDYMHLPVATLTDGKKLSKSTQSDPVKRMEPAPAVELALQFLGQNPPGGLTLDDLWQWALTNWDSKRIPPVRTRPLETLLPI